MRKLIAVAAATVALTCGGITAAQAVTPAMVAPPHGGGNCKITFGGNLGIKSITINITTNNCDYEVRAFVVGKFGNADQDLQTFLGPSIVGTGSSKAGFNLLDSPIQWGIQYLNSSGSWVTENNTYNPETITPS